MKSYNGFVSICNKVIDFLQTASFITQESVMYCEIDGEIVKFSYDKGTGYSDPRWGWDIVQIIDVELTHDGRVALTPRTTKRR